MDMSLYIDYREDGQPFVGLAYQEGMVAMRLYLFDKDSAVRWQMNIDKIAEELKGVKPKLIAVEGVLPNGRTSG